MPSKIFFTRPELNQILNIYGPLVAAGKIKDYAIFEACALVTFCFFGRASDRPLYRVVKDPRLQQKNSTFYILGSEGQILKRGGSLDSVLKFFHPQLLRLINAAGE